jgi:hypothetical protein
VQNVNRSFSASLRLSGALLFRSLCCSRRKDKCDLGEMAESAMSKQKASCRKRADMRPGAFGSKWVRALRRSGRVIDGRQGKHTRSAGTGLV